MSKGNPVQAGASGLFRDFSGTTLWIFAIDLGRSTNNEAEISTVKLGLDIAKREHYNRLEIEGDFAMVTGILKKLLQGMNWESITKSWRKTRLIQEIQQKIKQRDYVITMHVRWQGN